MLYTNLNSTGNCRISEPSTVSLVRFSAGAFIYPHQISNFMKWTTTFDISYNSGTSHKNEKNKLKNTPGQME